MSELDRWREDPEAFWLEQASRLAWTRPPSTALERHPDGSWTWFPDGEINVCALALDHHVEHGRADQTALIYDSPVTGAKRTFTYRQLRDEVA
ncbi:MAG: propionyl-CoA synthetase, partial [Alphaproteobacteria bacterium]|nr:propionyl-CoA synthetase [Alphaproteobacteria bacterium]